MADADVVSTVLQNAGFERVLFERHDCDVCIGCDMDDAIDFAMSLGPGRRDHSSGGTPMPRSTRRRWSPRCGKSCPAVSTIRRHLDPVEYLVRDGIQAARVDDFRRRLGTSGSGVVAGVVQPEAGDSSTGRLRPVRHNLPPCQPRLHEPVPDGRDHAGKHQQDIARGQAR